MDYLDVAARVWNTAFVPDFGANEMDPFTRFLTTALTADPLNLSLCAVITLAVAVVVIASRRS